MTPLYKAAEELINTTWVEKYKQKDLLFMRADQVIDTPVFYYHFKSIFKSYSSIGLEVTGLTFKNDCILTQI